MCSNPLCTEEFPTYYGVNKVCKTCYKARQQAYRKTEKGIAVHANTSKKYRHTSQGKAKVKEAYNRWASCNIRVDSKTLEIGYPFRACYTCIEDTAQGCSVINGSESIEVCEVYLDFKHCQAHPLKGYASSESELSSEEEEYWARYDT